MGGAAGALGTCRLWLLPQHLLPGPTAAVGQVCWHADRSQQRRLADLTPAPGSTAVPRRVLRGEQGSTHTGGRWQRGKEPTPLRCGAMIPLSVPLPGLKPDAEIPLTSLSNPWRCCEGCFTAEGAGPRELTHSGPLLPAS